MSSLRSLLTHSFTPVEKEVSGQVRAIKGSLIQATLPTGSVGDLCYVSRRDGSLFQAQLVSFQDDLVSLAPFDDLQGVYPGARVISRGERPQIPISNDVIGKVIDPSGRALNEDRLQVRPAPALHRPVFGGSPDPLERPPIRDRLVTGIKGIDLLCPVGVGQRMALLAGAGVGKSTLLGMIARNAEVDVSVIALVGERGREVNDFLVEGLGESGLLSSTVVVATSDEPSFRRLMAAYTATAIAEYFRDQGLRVLLLIDSLTRVARAIREVGLADGQLPVRHGYTANVYTELPKLLERAGTAKNGSITAFYTLLASAEDEEDPLAEEVKSLLDGHLLLSNKLAMRGMRPAIDFTRSISRLRERLFSEEDLARAVKLQRIIARLHADRDIVLLGGTPDPELKAALELEDDLMSVLTQRPYDSVDEGCASVEADRFLARFESRHSALSQLRTTS